jgi:hypothetical protein
VADLLSPNLAKNTVCLSNAIRAATSTNGLAVFYQGYLNNTTQYTAFTLTAVAGTLTGGTIRVYGYQNS